MGTEGWTRAGAGRLDLCRSCSAETARRSSRAGFTLTELLAVMAIVALVSAVALPTIVASWSDRGPTAGAGVVQAAIERARDLASSAGTVGVRFVPDPAWPIVRRADGTIDPERPLAYSRIVPLVQPPPYAEGLASVRTDPYPAAFVADGWVLPGRLILEEAVFDGKAYPGHPEGVRANPTNWWWNVRVGDVVNYLGRAYTVAGPQVVDSAEGFVNVGAAGQVVSPLDRAEDGNPRPAEFLYLVNRVDDDRDGWIDSGWDGIDNNLNGEIDENAEWEDERWAGRAADAAGVVGAPYSIARRPSAGKGGFELPAGFVVDATTWAGVLEPNPLAPGRDHLVFYRSKLPVDPRTGAVEILFDKLGQVDAPSVYGRPAVKPIDATHMLFWIASRSDVLAPPASSGAGKVVALHYRTGRSEVVEADGADPQGTFARAEGRGR